jgi:hypothetical protein
MDVNFTDFKGKTSGELDAQLSELQFDILFLKCQVSLDSNVEARDLSDVNDQIAGLESKASVIESELERRSDNPCGRKPLPSVDDSLEIEEFFRMLPKSTLKGT